jgi:hypothetical protein
MSTIALLEGRERPRSIVGGLSKAHRCYSAFVNAQPGDRPSLPGAVLVGRSGRGAPDGGGALCGDEPGPSAAGRSP